VIAPTGTILLARCEACHGRSLPTEGPCPRCGGRTLTQYEVLAEGKVLAATALESPAEGWTAPHRLALIEVADSVRLLATVEGELPGIGATVTVRSEGPVYVVRASGAGSG
jgi:uncharacterized OB-fold protein